MSLSIRLPKVFKYSIFIVLLAMPLGNVVGAESTRVFLDPPSQTVAAAGDSFTINVSIADVSNLLGYQFTIYYNSTVMNRTQVAEGSFLKSGGQTYFSPSFIDQYNSTHGAVAISCTLLNVTGNVSGASGSGVLVTLEFKSLAAADSTSLHLADVGLVGLADSSPSLIPHEDSDGTVTVVPEFTSLIAFLALIAASLSSILVKNGAKRKVDNLNS